MWNKLKKLRRLLAIYTYSGLEKWSYAKGLYGSGQLCMPDFLCIGAQKSGTTWLYENLRCHPELFLPERKELHYFDLEFHKSLRYYADQFAPGEHKVGGEVTPAYSVLPKKRIRFIHTIMPDAKLIFLMRNPIDRAWSHAVMDLVTERNRKFDEVLDSEFMGFLKSDACIQRGNYIMILNNWLNFFSQEQFYIGFFEDVVERPQQLLSDIFLHLGVSRDVDWSCFPFQQVIRPQIGQEKEIKKCSTSLRPTIRNFLEKMYADDMEQLHRRFGGGWRRATS